MEQYFTTTGFSVTSTIDCPASQETPDGAVGLATTAFDVVAAEAKILGALMSRADRDAAQRGGVVANAIADDILAAGDAIAALLDKLAGDRSGLSDDERADFGARIRELLMPLLSQSHLSERICSKPRGYAGDYLTIALMYEDVASGASSAGRILDRAIRNQPACTAVTNRRGILAEEISRVRAESSDEVARVTSLACGPAAELFDVFDAIDDPSSLMVTCVDIDDQALNYVADRSEQRGLRDQFALHLGNLVRLATGRRRLAIPPQDLVYSIGLIDYFEDRFVVRLLDYVHGLLKPGGRTIFGNFHVDNPSKALMDHVLDWKLIHRTEDDMHRLFRASKFARNCTNIRFEGEGVNMFAECVRTGSKAAVT